MEFVVLIAGESHRLSGNVPKVAGHMAIGWIL